MEYRTPAICHAYQGVLSQLDAVQTRFVKDVGVDEATALIGFCVAPLSISVGQCHARIDAQDSFRRRA